MAPAATTQASRPLQVTTPLGPDVLLLTGVSGREGLSELFSFHLDLLAENKKKIAFDRLLGQEVTASVALPDGEAKRYFSGVCKRMAQGERGEQFTDYDVEIVPQFWLLSKKVQSRIFQRLSVPEILRKVLQGLDVVYQIQGTFQPRDFCVQYRESDFHFASRLMEEEGIYYFFQHSAGSHKMVLANTPGAHPAVPQESELLYKNVESGAAGGNVIYDWSKVQELRSGKYTLWDHCFELPHKHLQADKSILDSAAVGRANHKLKVEAADRLEVYDYPGGYAQRFDGIDKGGADKPENLQGIFEDNQRTVEIRMQEEAALSLVLQGGGTYRQLTAGHKFTLTTRAHTLESQAEADGPYVLTSVQHVAKLQAGFRSGVGRGFQYHNTFTCIPAELPYRPRRITPRPVVQGTQTAVVVGPSDEDIFTDKYGRVKVQFHWDREGENNIDSSCWVRVGTIWAGKQWGAIHIPRIGQEVIVDFLEGDPDQPIIIGSVYNAEMMPPYPLPDQKTRSGIKSRSTLEGEPANFNELRFEDKKDEEDIYFHAEKDFHRIVENNDDLKVGFEKKDEGNQTIEIFNNQSLKVGCSDASDGSQTIEIWKDRTATVKEGDEQVTIAKGNRTVTVTEGTDTHEVKGDRTVTVKEGDDTHEIKQGDRDVTVAMGDDKLAVSQGKRDVKIEMGDDKLKISMGNQETKVDLGKIETEAMQSIEIKVGQSSIKLEQSGVTIKGLQVKIEGTIQAEMKGVMTTVKGDGLLTLKGGIAMIN